MTYLIGDTIKRIRESKNLSTYEVSKLCGISQSTISKLENGKRKPDVILLEKIAKVFDVSINEFFTDENVDKDVTMLGDNIRSIRKSKGLSINKLAKITGISLGYISDLENNKFTNPTMDKIKKIATALDVSESQILDTGIKEQIQSPDTVIWENDKIPDKLRGIGVEYITIAKELEDSELTPEEIRSIFSAVIAIKKDKK